MSDSPFRLLLLLHLIQTNTWPDPVSANAELMQACTNLILCIIRSAFAERCHFIMAGLPMHQLYLHCISTACMPAWVQEGGCRDAVADLTCQAQRSQRPVQVSDRCPLLWPGVPSLGADWKLLWLLQAATVVYSELSNVLSAWKAGLRRRACEALGSGRGVAWSTACMQASR